MSMWKHFILYSSVVEVRKTAHLFYQAVEYTYNIYKTLCDGADSLTARCLNVFKVLSQRRMLIQVASEYIDDKESIYTIGLIHMLSSEYVNNHNFTQYFSIITLFVLSQI